MFKYRNEIDGLRALAILPVIFFHAGFSFFKGGFIGVDIFFVISGYLITSIILFELNNNSFSFINFYERRVRRIFPALFFVLCISSIISWIYLIPNDTQDFFKSLVRSLFYISNIYFYRHSGYFDAASELKPLIHTWSLSIEEQYYLVLPLLIFFSWNLFRKYIFFILSILFILSLFYCQYKITSDSNAAFYFFLTRAWELIAGSLTAYYIANEKNKFSDNVSEIGSFLGFILIVSTFFIFNNSLPLPSFYTLIPVIGTALIILFANSETLIGGILQNKILSIVGLTSYSSYLWHQPILSFVRHLQIDEPSTFSLLFFAVLSLFFGYLSWKYIELPFRKKEFISRKYIFLLLILFTLLFSLIGIIGSEDGFKYRFNKYYLQHPENIQLQASCTPLDLTGNDSIKTCIFGDPDSKNTVALWGDSHASALLYELDRNFKKQGIRGLRVELKNCGSIPGLIDESYKSRMTSILNKCSHDLDDINNKVIKDIDATIISIRWATNLVDDTGKVFFDNEQGGVELGNFRPKVALDDNDKFTANQNVKGKKVLNLLSFFNSTKPIFLIYPIPEMGWDISRINLKRFVLGEKDLAINSNINVSYASFIKRNLYTYKILDSFKSKNIYRIKPEIHFCNTLIQDRCIGQYQNNQYYIDSHHLSNLGAGFIVSEILNGIRQQKLSTGYKFQP